MHTAFITTNKGPHESKAKPSATREVEPCRRLKGTVVSVDMEYGLAFVKAEDGRVFGVSDAYIPAEQWGKLKKDLMVSFEDNGYGATEKLYL